jgi:hypothetical protein
MSGQVGARTPWATGLVVSGFAAVLTGIGVAACGAAMAAVHPLLALVVNVLVAVGVAPTLWQWRTVPVWRWAVLGAVVWVVAGWIALLAGAG